MYPVRKNESVSSIKCDRIDNINSWSAELRVQVLLFFLFFMFLIYN